MVSPVVPRLLRASLATTSKVVVEDQVARLVAAATARDLAGLPAGARYHGVTGYVRRATSGLTLPPGVAEQLEADRLDAVRVHLLARQELLGLDELFRTAGIDWLVMKGPVLAEHYHDGADLRFYDDLDILVPPDQLGAAVDLLESMGGDTSGQTWSMIQGEPRGEVLVRVPSGMPIDLHWHLINTPRIRRAFDVDLLAMFDRSRTVRVGGLDVRTLSPADTLVYVALHAVLSGADRLMWLKDIERVVRHEPGAHEAAHVVARAWDAELAVAGALTRTALAIDGFRAPAALRPQGPGSAAWLRVCRLAWQRVPAEDEDGSGSLGRIVARSSRGDARRSARELARRSALGVVRRSSGRPTELEDGVPGEERGGRHDRSRQTERAAFLAWVEQQGGLAHRTPPAASRRAVPGQTPAGARRAARGRSRGATLGQDATPPSRRAQEPVDGVHVPADVLVQRLPNGDTVLLNLATEGYSGLNRTGTIMWEALVEAGSVTEALARLRDELDAPIEVLRHDLDALIHRLMAGGLLVLGEPSPDAGTQKGSR